MDSAPPFIFFRYSLTPSCGFVVWREYVNFVSRKSNQSVVMVFSLDISPLCWTLMGVALACAIVLSTLYCRRVSLVWKQNRRGNAALNDTPSALPHVSVVVYCNDTPSSLSRLLEMLLSQRYDAPYEIIIVNDGSSESVKDVFNRLSLEHHNLYLTFIPDEAHNLSRRKLAITLGLKAARNKFVLFVDASSSIGSADWLRSMARHFSDGKDIVLGYAAFDRHADIQIGKRLRAFDTAADAVTYLSSALKKHPYRGHLDNFGINRELFFTNKGFSKSLNLHNGADDIFIEEIALPDNTTVELSDASRVTLGGDLPRAFHRRWKWGHIFTGRYVSHRSRYIFSFFSSILWLGAASTIAAILVGVPNMLPLTIMAVVSLSLWTLIMLTWRRALRALAGRKLFLTVPWFVMMRPFYNLYYRIVERRHRKENFTWSKPRR